MTEIKASVARSGSSFPCLLDHTAGLSYPAFREQSGDSAMAIAAPAPRIERYSPEAEHALTLPSHYYYDPDIYEREKV